MVTIQPDKQVFTLVNVFHVAPENQQALADLLIKATKQTMRHFPGFLSVNIHRSHDGKRVINYAQWRSKEDVGAVLNDPEVQAHAAEAAALAESSDPILCEVVKSIE